MEKNGIESCGNCHIYDDIIHMPHHVSSTRPHMDMLGRAAQFTPFAALTGYGEQIQEAGRLTDSRPVLSEDEKDILDRKIRFLESHLNAMPQVSLTYFSPDGRKDGGVCLNVEGVVKKIDAIRRTIIFFADGKSTDGLAVSIGDILGINISGYTGDGFQ